MFLLQNVDIKICEDHGLEDDSDCKMKKMPNSLKRKLRQCSYEGNFVGDIESREGCIFWEIP